MEKKKKVKPTYKQVKVNFLPGDFEKLEYLAEEAGVKKAKYLRSLIGAKIEDERVPKKVEKSTKVEIVVDRNWTYELNRIGNNLNQAVEAMHTQRAKIELKALSLCIQSLDNLSRQIEEYVKVQK